MNKFRKMQIFINNEIFYQTKLKIYHYNKSNNVIIYQTKLKKIIKTK